MTRAKKYRYDDAGLMMQQEIGLTQPANPIDEPDEEQQP